MKFNYDFYESLLLINSNLTKDIFLEKAGAQDRYSKDMFSRMFDSIFSELISVEEEYSKYYSFEYKSFEQFLYKKYNLDVEEIEKIMKLKKELPNCILYRKEEFSYGEYGIMQFAFSDTMYERVCDILQLKE